MYLDIDCVFQSFGGKGRIYISDMSTANNSQLLQNLKIKSIISVAKSGLLTNKSQQILNYLYIPAEDHQYYQIKKHFNLTNQFIQKARKQANILVHCISGISRSATIVIAYLLKKYQYSLSTVLPLLKRKRNKINPNKGFIKQLQKYSIELGIKEIYHQKTKYKRNWSVFQFQKNKEQNTQLKKENKKQEIKKLSIQKKSTAISINNSLNEKTPKQIQKIDEKINILREKVIMVGKLKSKLNKSKNIQNKKLFSVESQQSKSNINQNNITWKESKSYQFMLNQIQ